MEKKSAKVSYQLFLFKWVFIGVALFIIIFTLVFVIYSSLSVKSVKDKILLEKKTSSDDIYAWYEDLPLIRGTSKDRDIFFIIKVNFAYPEKKADKTSDEIFNKRFIIVDVLLKYFSSLEGSFLINNNNRIKIKYEVIDSVNKLLSYPIEDVGFTEYNMDAL